MSMNVSFLFLSLLKPNSRFVLKAGAKVQLLFSFASAFEIIFSFYFRGNLLIILKNLTPFRFIVSGSAKIQPLFVFANLFLKFFQTLFCVCFSVFAGERLL